MKRLREIDFLRGVAIILVLLRHKFLFPFTKNMGWIGVDLFFVISGFLVSGLLFKEYQKSGSILPKRFLIRRGFKIYPIYYLFYIPYIFSIFVREKWDLYGFLSDILFLQNYLLGWGYAYAASWSLAVEEHFYFGFAISFWLIIKYAKQQFNPEEKNKNGIGVFEKAILLIMLICLILRFYSNMYFPEQFARNMTMTHLRIDSLLAGVLISYFFHFRKDSLIAIFKPFRYIFLALSFLALIWTPFVSPVPSFFVKTIGFSLLYIAFGIILIYFLTDENINAKLDKIFSTNITNLVSRIGFCSYSIYIIHTFVNFVTEKVIVDFGLYYNHYLNFIVTSAFSISLGMIMTYKIEAYFLRIRDKYFPSRISPLQ